ncbi:hypothetical protein [Sulfuriflexus sp.]|uniref:hypothetical protein n=1 Tax=Sulfuriflexus sp. TaxID=2015443 RepID=UPI0028CEAF03|nr:hypothetical protein [Sulfuriflexus sp.]MDT8404729.1 hypothetical protein [Sulfuriflexus sp.]
MSKIISLADSFINVRARRQLESFGGHTIAHGRATRWHWVQSSDAGNIFEIYRGGTDETLAARVVRGKDRDTYCAYSGSDELIASGSLEHILAELEVYFSRLHGEFPDAPA